MADTTCRYGVASRMVQRVPDRGFRGVFLFSTPASALPACPSVRSVACIALQPKGCAHGGLVTTAPEVSGMQRQQRLPPGKLLPRLHVPFPTLGRRGRRGRCWR
jgi:hypothetical protein